MNERIKLYLDEDTISRSLITTLRAERIYRIHVYPSYAGLIHNYPF